MITHVDILSVPVSDQNRALGFYRDVLGFDLIAQNPMGPDQTWMQLRPAGGGASITLVTWFDAMPPGSVQGLVLCVDDLEGTRANLVEKGVAASEVERTPWGAFVMFKDPDGNGIVLQQGGGEAT